MYLLTLKSVMCLERQILVLVHGSLYCTLRIKAMIPEMKGSILLPDPLPELDNPSPGPENHEDASLTKIAEEEKEEGEVTEAAPEDGSVKRQVSIKRQESGKTKA